MGTWIRYWSAPGGRRAAAVVRIAIALAVMLLLVRSRDLPAVVHPELMSASVYHPVGILLLFPSPPPAIAIELAALAAWAGTLAMLIGLRTRTATLVAALGVLVVASQAMSYQPSWSHDLNIVVLALLGFVGARGGDALAIDAVLQRRRGGPPLDASYQWSLRLVQLAVGLVFVSACAVKLRSGGLSWALSDNLRHQLLLRYDLSGRSGRPAIVDWLLARSWRYEGAALLNLISQVMPLAAILCPDRPRVRAVAALCFVSEVTALHVVMTLGDRSWFPLAAVFIDWDRLWAWATRRALDAPVRPPCMPRAAGAFVAAFLALDLATSFTPQLDQRLRSYPFSRFAMFATVRAKRPYARHQSYELIAGRIELVTDRPIERSIQAEIDDAYRTLHRETDREVLRARTAVLLEEVRRRYPALAVRGVRVYATMYQIPAYPAPARFESRDLGILGELIDGAWISHDRALTEAGRLSLAGDPALAGAALVVYQDGLPAGEPLVADAAGALLLPPGPGLLHIVARLPGRDGVVRPYVVARRTRHYW